MSKVKKYRKKPVVIEAIQYTKENVNECLNFCEGAAFINCVGGVAIKTLEGGIIASIGDYIIKGIKGEFYPCKPDIFKKTYEEVKEDSDARDKV